jgi:hypothetical protein
MLEERLTFFKELLAGETLIVLDLGARCTEESPLYEKLIPLGPRIVGIDAEGSAEQSFKAQFGPDTRCEFIAAFLGTGEEREFYECERPSVSSVFEPNIEVCGRFDGLTDAAVVTGRRRIKTEPLTGLVGSLDADLIKSDLQGADLQVLGNSLPLLARSVLLVVEVEFIEQFKNAPLAWTVMDALRQWQCDFHSFLDFGTRPLAGYDQLWCSKRRGFRQWLWGNAVFVPSPARLAGLESPKLLKMAAIMDGMMGCYDYAWTLLGMYDARAGTALADRYRELLGKDR